MFTSKKEFEQNWYKENQTTFAQVKAERELMKNTTMKNTTSNTRITVKKNLGKTGLSMSDAQSASNMANQIAISIERDFERVNNFEKTISVAGYDKVLQRGVKMPNDVVELVKKKAQCHALQAFLMESIKLKEALISEEKNKVFTTDLVAPVVPKSFIFNSYNLVDETFGWNQLSESEYNDFLENEAMASHYGQFIHKDSILDELRKEIDTVPTIEWFEVEKDKKTPVDINVHHTKVELDDLHIIFSHLHRDAEKRVNYFKAKVKNLVSQENSRIEKVNAEGMDGVRVENKTLMDEYNGLFSQYNQKREVEFKKFQSQKEINVNELSSLKIVVDPRFKTLLDETIGERK
jgi:hypothetical protein